jgi:hypothetical protein
VDRSLIIYWDTDGEYRSLLGIRSYRCVIWSTIEYWYLPERIDYIEDIFLKYGIPESPEEFYSLILSLIEERSSCIPPEKISKWRHWRPSSSSPMSVYEE